MVRKAHNLAFPQDPAHGVLGCFSVYSLIMRKTSVTGFWEASTERPAGHLFRDGVHECDLSFHVAGNDRVTDTRQGGGPALLAFLEGSLCSVSLGDLCFEGLVDLGEFFRSFSSLPSMSFCGQAVTGLSRPRRQGLRGVESLEAGSPCLQDRMHGNTGRCQEW